MIRAHKIRLHPNNKQATHFANACGTSRFAFNWALNEWKTLYEQGEKVTEGIIRKRLNAIKKDSFPWMYEVSKCIPQLAIKNNLNSAFQMFFKSATNSKKEVGYPKFKKKGLHDSFTLDNISFEVKNKKIKIPHLTPVNMKEELRYKGKLLNATISKVANKWFVSIQVEIEDSHLQLTTYDESQVTGVDLGCKDLAVLSDGTKITGIKPSRVYSRKLKRLNQELSRRKGSKKGEKKSNNFLKTRRKLATLHYRIASLRQDQTHKLTTWLVDNFKVIGIEDLNVEGMVKNHNLARAIEDMNFGEFRRQLEYKALEKGVKVVVLDRWFPSSKTCNVCGSVNKELILKDRTWKCVDCGAVLDRDINAARNIKQVAVSSTVAQPVESSWVASSMKQELNNRFVQKCTRLCKF